VKIGSQAVRKKTITLIDAQVFDDVTTTKTSTSIDISAYRWFELLIDLAVTGTPTDLLIEAEVSDDDTTFYKHMRGPFGDLRYEDTAGDLREAIGDVCPSNYLRVKATATGTTALNKFTLTVKIAIMD